MENNPKHLPSSLRGAQLLFFINALVWLAFGTWTVIGMVSSNRDAVLTPLIISVLMVGNASAMLISGIGIGTRKRFYFLLAMLVLVVNILLTFTDQFGFFDLTTLILDIILVVLLIFNWKDFS